MQFHLGALRYGISNKARIRKLIALNPPLTENSFDMILQLDYLYYIYADVQSIAQPQLRIT